MNKLLLIFEALILVLCVSSCTGKRYGITRVANPWPDDYSAVSDMTEWQKWGTYNVHDPAVIRVGDTYYMYSTDAIYRENHRKARESGVPLGYIQMRSSRDLVHWDFLGWALAEIPSEAVEWVRTHANGHGATNIWAPYPVACPDGSFRLYFCVSAFGRNTSYIGLATAPSPAGPWTHVGPVVRTDKSSAMNAIDPSVITSGGRQYMHYGSYFGGLYCVELDPATGFPLRDGDQGHLVARRANYRKDNLEAPEIIYNKDNGKYYLFGSYDPLMTTYNVRAGRSDSPDGPFVDFHGKQMADTTDNFPIITAPYRFGNHPGWVGTAHCGVFSDGEGRFFMAHQGRYASDPGMMDLHVRRVFFTPDGWPVVSPERYAGESDRHFRSRDLIGKWEIIRLHEPQAKRELEAGQIRWGEGNLLTGEWCLPGTITLEKGGNWTFDENSQLLSLSVDGEVIENLIIFAGHDWEQQTNTVLFTGLDADGRSVWGKRIR